MHTKVEEAASRHPLPPEGSPEELAWARQRARRAALTILLPFLLAVAMGLGQRFFGIFGAVGDLTQLAEKAVAPSEGAPEPIARLAHRLAEDVYGHEHHEDQTERFENLVRVVANEVDGMKGTTPVQKVKAFRRATRLSLLRNSWFPTGLQAVLVLFFPALLMSSFWRAAQGIEDASGLAPSRFPSFASAIWYRRYRTQLHDQRHSYFWRRAGFAFLIGYGSVFLVAPLGVKAMVIGEYLVMNAIPGEPTYPFLLTAFERAQPFSIGFAGFYLYAVTVFVRRFATHDLNDRIFLPLFIRGITVVLLSWVLASLGEESGLSRALVFAVGIFPQAGLQAIAKMTKTTVDRLADEGGAGFRTIPEIDFWKETTLQELGIHDFNDLAKADVREVLVSLGMNPAVLIRAVDRAALIHALGAEAAAKLAAIPLFTASELVLYTQGRDAYAKRWGEAAPPFDLGTDLSKAEKDQREKTVEQALGALDVCLQLDQLKIDHNVLFIIDNRVDMGASERLPYTAEPGICIIPGPPYTKSTLPYTTRGSRGLRNPSIYTLSLRECAQISNLYTSE